MSEKLSLSKVASGLQDSLKNPTTQVTLVSAAGGSVAAGTCGAAVGLFSGGALGAACGVIPAVFTFGLSIPIGAAIGSGAGLFAGTAVGGSIGAVGGGTAGYLYKTKGKKKQEGPAVKFFDSRDVDQVIPLPPKSYPAALQGMIWMDQGGAFGKTDVPFSAPDLALSFGDTAFSMLDAPSRTIDVDVTGPAWQWMNAKDAYFVFLALKKIGFFYHFQFNEDYSHVQIYPSVNLGALGKWSLPKLLMSFTMVLQTPPADIGPFPTASTLYEDRVKFAKWDRVSSGLLSPLLGKYGVFHYYVYQIVDGEGRRVQPYYDACTSLASQSTKPDPSWAVYLGLEVPEGHGFVGLRSDSLSSSSSLKTYGSAS
mmetsp:Transcript_22449/g.40519  ORF Transcript_22449/g.40519 Transcript_22449/m.40519 type:complete len:367 (+) Transcript_22449:48-1148(+)